MASVAAADADRQIQRRRDHGIRLDEARQDLLRILHDPSPLNYNLTVGLPPSSVDNWPPSEDSSVPAPTIENTSTTTSRHSVIEAIKAICVPPTQLRRHAAETQKRESYLTWLHAQFGMRRRWWYPRPAPDEGLEKLAEAMLEEETATQHTLLDGQREPQSAVQFDRMTEATNRLVNNLVEEGHRIGSFGDPVAQKRSMEHLESPWHALRLLRSDGYPSFRMPSLDPEATTAARLEANEAARKIFRSWSDVRINGPRATPFQMAIGRSRPVDPEVWNAKEVQFWVFKLCYNILVSPAPPGIHNYNTLMLGFISVGQHTLAQIVAESLLYDMRLLPTQQTVVCLLHQARAQEDLVGFHRVLRRIVALDPRGLKLRRRAIPDVSHYRHNHEWARRNDVSLTDQYVVQRAAVDGPVIEAIITGLLSLDQARHAAVVLSAYLDECTHIDAPSLTSVLDPVLDAVDIAGARVLLRSFAKNSSLVNMALMTETRASQKLAMRMRMLMAIATAPEPALYAQPEQERMRQSEMQGAREQDLAEEELYEDAPLSDLAFALKLRANGRRLTKPQAKLISQYEAAAAASKSQAELEHLQDEQFQADSAKNMANSASYACTMFNQYGSGAHHLAAALFVAETHEYLSRLSKVASSIQKIVDASEQGDVFPFAARSDAWSSRLDGLGNLTQRYFYEQEQYRRMARLKAVDQTSEAVLSSCSHIMEQFMETVTADLAATSAAAAAAEAKYESDALQIKNDSFLSIIKSFLGFTSVPFSVRMAAYTSTAQTYKENMAGAGAHAQSENLEDGEHDYDHDEYYNGNDPDNQQGLETVSQIRPSLQPFSLSPSLAQQISLLERHLSEDMPAVTALYENQLKETLLQGVFPISENSRNSLQKTFDLRRGALDMSLDSLVEARLALMEHGATFVENLVTSNAKKPALSITDGREDLDGQAVHGWESSESASTTFRDAYGNPRMGAAISS